MERYTAINIGPIISTLGMARKPRELWAASLFFSQMMKYVIDSISISHLISPAKEKKEEKLGIGLYPDRIFVNGDYDYNTILDNVIKKYSKDIHVDPEIVKGYVNLMHVQKDSDKSESLVIKELNQIMDWLELNNRETKETYRNGILTFIQKGYHSPLFNMVYADRKMAQGNNTIAEIATKQLYQIDQEKWEEALNSGKNQEEAKETYKKIANISDNIMAIDDITINEDAFYVELKELFEKEIKSYHKYICVVQADGDNMGKTFSHKDLPNGEVGNISERLLEFDKNASKLIYEYGGFPIYAGGDDLLFLAPVVGMTKDKNGNFHNILDLLEKIDSTFNEVKEYVKNRKLYDDDDNPIIPSMSYGVSITYYKYPLYEAFGSACKLLFEVAKVIKGKNAIAWELRKHSGSILSGAFSKNDLLNEFKQVIKNSSVKDSLVSAVSHKIRQNEGLLSLWLDNENYEMRNKNFFKQYMDYKEGDKYKKSVLDLLNKLYPLHNTENYQGNDKNDRISILITKAYSMLRTAKFIRGEEVIDE